MRENQVDESNEIKTQRKKSSDLNIRDSKSAYNKNSNQSRFTESRTGLLKSTNFNEENKSEMNKKYLEDHK